MQSFMYSSHFSPSFPSGETSLTSQRTMSNAIVYVLVAFLTVFSIRGDFSDITGNYE